MATSQSARQALPIRTRPGTTATTTQTHTETQPQQTRPILVLRAEGATTRHIQWAEDVVDNEGMGKKSSKVCCIYHKPHAAGESSGDDSDSSDSDSNLDSEPDNSRARPAGGAKRSRAKRRHNHKHDEDKDGDGRARKPSPNAYERVPKYKPAQPSGPSS
ncbi:hypothetical protein BT63DRAFT_482557 [Microthyrium microscopicum]|uniref:Type 1 phosphatases regulator n=1 Tax=Microthyrium microscopicum TaxID=703497 RepID=A0A6A6U007_9PEZI|nr:hypothetical protein BT63DRAFT_482557 [Microthyrium microscopicum]